MKKISIIFLILITALIFLTSCAQKEEKNIKIGAILPLSGPSSYIGQNLMNGMELAVEELDGNLELIIEDSMNNPKTAVSALKNMLLTNDFDIIISAMSTVTNSIIPLVNEEEIPLLCTVVSTKGITKENPGLFRFFTKADIDAKTMAEYVYNELNLRNIAIIHLQDDFGVSYAEVFKEIFEKQGGKISAVENFLFGAKDFRTQLMKIKAENPDGVYILAYADNLALIPKQMDELEIDAEKLSIGTIAQSFVIEQAPEAIEGTYYTTNAFSTYNPQTAEIKKFVQNFEKKFGKKPEYFEVFGYDSIYLISEALKKGNIRDGLFAIKEFKGAAGKISITKEGEIDFPIVIGKIEDGKMSKPLKFISF